MISRKKISFAIIVAILFITVFSIMAYISYGNYYEGRNTKENNMAKTMYYIVESSLHTIDKSEVNDNLIISSNKKFEVNANMEDEFYKEMKRLSEINNIDYVDDVYYIEIRNKEVYRVIYADWNYSGYVGVYPEYNVTCDSYMTIVKEAYNEFNLFVEKCK